MKTLKTMTLLLGHREFTRKLNSSLTNTHRHTHPMFKPNQSHLCWAGRALCRLFDVCVICLLKHCEIDAAEACRAAVLLPIDGLDFFFSFVKKGPAFHFHCRMKVMQLQKQCLPLVVLFCPLLWLFGLKPKGFPSQLAVSMF